MVYETDIKEIRDMRESVSEAKENLQILAIEKEINTLEDAIDGIDNQIENVNDHYDKLIDQTKDYYKSMEDSLQSYLDRWEELSKIEEQAKMQVALKNLGIETTDILNMSEEAFNTFKNQYLSILTEMYNGETDMVNAINSVAQGIDYTTLETGLTKTKDNIDKLNNADFTSVKTGLDSVATGMTSVGDSASTASTNTDAISSDLKEMNDNATGLDTKLGAITTTLNGMPDGTKFEGLTSEFEELAKAIEDVGKALSVTDGESVGTLVTALSQLSSVSLMGDGGEGIITQFNNLKSAIEGVTSAISGGGFAGESASGTTASPTRGSGGGGESSGQGSTTGLSGAIEELGRKTEETIGTGGDSEESSGGSGVLGKFSDFKNAVDLVTKAIGSGEDEEGAEEGASTLIGALQLHYQTAEDTLPLVKDRFIELLESITACIDKLSELAGAMSSLGGISIGTIATPTTLATGTDPQVSFTNMTGKAFAKGTGMFKGLSKDEPFAVVSEYGQPETVITPDGSAMLTTSPTALSLKKDTVVLNEEQTMDMLNNKPQVIGKTYQLGSDGKLPYLDTSNMSEFEIVSELMRRAEYMQSLNRDIVTPISAIRDHTESMEKQISNINNVNNSNNRSVVVGDVNITCTGVTSKEVMNQIGMEFKRQLSGISLDAVQLGNITR